MKNIFFLYFLVLILVNACTPKATKYMNLAKKDYEEAEYQLAIDYFQQALKYGAPETECNYYIAESYRRSNRLQESEPYYRKAIEGKTSEEDAYFYYGQALKSVGNYEGAAAQFKQYISIGTNFDLINRAKTELANLKVINDIISKDSYYKVYNIEQLNTEHAEYSPFLFNDKLYFTTARGANKMHTATNTGFTDLYEFIFDGTTEFSGQARRMHSNLNTEDAHEASAIFTPDGKTIIFSRGNDGSKKGPQDVDIYQATLQPDGSWSEPVLLPINDPKAWDSCPSLSRDGKTLYFASNRENGFGGVDLYKSVKGPDGQWGPPQNLGAPINTKGGELFPYESPHGVLFFSSDGHPSLGALDIFYVKKENGKITIENMGRPINSSYDDFAIFFKDTTKGFFTSNRPGGKGDDDIYEFKMMESEVIFNLDILSLWKKQNDTTELVLENTTVKIINDKGDTLETIVTDNLGKARKQLTPGSYRLLGKKDGYLTTNTVNVNIVKPSADQLKPGKNEINYTAKVVLNQLMVHKEGEEIIINNIFYDFDKADIRPDAAIELNKIVELLKNNPDIKIELASHTDERGSDRYNQILSQKRAESAVNYIISKGIDKKRITAKGYGESKLIVKNASTEEEHQRNRRTAFRITSIGNSKVKIVNQGEDKGIY
ncbi:MAG: OmpA family protein [Cytophagaceae bacterium]|nr:OmpA family protein [Cytophagaceae bacterium]MDW8455155.1 OmpA family protein [Cytophagaceae bacterium]